MLIDRGSLSQTVDAINAAQCGGRTLTAAERGEVARWIAARRGLPGAYADTFAGFPADRSKGIVLSEMGSAEAGTELRYAVPALERAASRAVPSAIYARRRHELAVRIMNRF